MSTFSVYHFIAWYDQLPLVLQYATVFAQAIWCVQAVAWVELIQVSTQEWGAVVYRFAWLGVLYALISRLPDVSRFFERLVDFLPL